MGATQQLQLLMLKPCMGLLRGFRTSSSTAVGRLALFRCGITFSGADVSRCSPHIKI